VSIRLELRKRFKMETARQRLTHIQNQLVTPEPTSCPVKSQGSTCSTSCKTDQNCCSASRCSTNSLDARLTNRSPLRVCVTGAAGNIAYSLVFMIANGDMFGPHQQIYLHLLDIEPMAKVLQAVKMELVDGAYPLLKGIVTTIDVKEAFLHVDVAILVGAFPRKKGMERKDLLKSNADIFRVQGKSLSDYASRDVKVLVVGNPANTNSLIAQVNAPSIPKENFTALTRLDHNRARSQIALKLNVPIEDVHNVAIWGNHSSTQYPDVSSGYISNWPKPGLKHPIKSALNDEAWIEKEFIPTVQQRGAAIIQARNSSSAGSAARAIVDHMRDWLVGTRPGEWVSMGVISDGSYGAPKDIIYSFPVTCSGGKWQIVQGLNLNEFSKKRLELTANELVEERQEAFSYLNSLK